MSTQFKSEKVIANLNYKDLFKKFTNDDRAWQRWAWIIERKFSEWNLKNINENKNENNHKGEIKINYNIPNGDKL